MKLGASVSWERDVFPCWQRSANNAARPNSDVWGPFPLGICWYEANVEEADIPLLYLIGSSDLCESFGSYRIADIDRAMAGDDQHNHKVRVRALSQAIRAGRSFERPVAVGNSGTGPFVLIDGNHRALAFYAEQRLQGLELYLGILPGMTHAYKWAWPARVY